jgi:hypothetical protein
VKWLYNLKLKYNQWLTYRELVGVLLLRVDVVRKRHGQYAARYYLARAIPTFKEFCKASNGPARKTDQIKRKSSRGRRRR